MKSARSSAVRFSIGLLFLFLAAGLTTVASALDLGDTGRATPWGEAGLWSIADHRHDEPPFMAVVEPPQSGRLILVRHADRNRNETNLNARGRARAEALPDALADLPIDAIFMAAFQRNADTAGPLAAAHGLDPIALEPDETLPITLVAAAEERNVIWIGNVGNLVDLWQALGFGGAAPTRYGDIAVLTAFDGTWEISWRRF
ncbi:MAG: histidine phosphatase family protein [Pseudomonadota bacterium]